jgi:hypothetical protein
MISALQYWQTLSKQKEPGWLVYAGEQTQVREKVTIIGWQQLQELTDKIDTK